MKHLFFRFLGFIAHQVILRHKPFIVGVTGTVGKTTTTHFVFDFLSTLYPWEVYMSPFSYNGEIGIPLTIFKKRSPGKNPFGWIWVILCGIGLLFRKTYPKYLVLEYGIDHPWEMAQLVKIAKPNIGIILNISKNHVAFFSSFQEYVKEKMRLALNSEVVITNNDVAPISSFLPQILDKKILTYSARGNGGILQARNVHSNIEGISFSLLYEGKEYEMCFPLLGDFQIYNILPVFVMGITLGVDIVSIRDMLANINPQKGRGAVLKWYRESIIIDGSYNGGLESISRGVEYIASLDDNYEKILFLGDMRELGNESKELHKELADTIMSYNYSLIVLVGEEMRKFVFPFLVERFGENWVHSFLDSRKAGQVIRESLSNLEKRTIVYVKGSQNTIYLEEGIKAFLFDPHDIDKLCRQTPEWIRKKQHFFDHVVGN